jgi:membrane-associated phospholipid phosphatase
MTRGVGEFAIQECIPAWAAVAVAVLTQLGDLWFLGVVLAGLYWLQPDTRDETALVGAMLLVGLGLYRGLKELFALPRPGEPPATTAQLPELIQPFWESVVTPASYGFPSGHATSAAIVYVGLAAVLTVGARRQRFVAAGGLVSVVSLSRVALGVHYLVDVVAGIALGVCLVAVGVRLFTTRRTERMLGVAIPTSAFYVLTSDATLESIALLGVAVAAFVGWTVISDSE